jgi:HPr kinase/phosphorylase
MTAATIHASAILLGARAVLIRGPSGAGKSRLAYELLTAAQAGFVRFARLVGDDRLHVEAAGGRLLVRPAPALAALIELRGIGLLRLPYEPCAVVGLVVDLAAPEAQRLPPAEQRRASIAGIDLPRLAVAPGSTALPGLLALITSSGDVATDSP